MIFRRPKVSLRVFDPHHPGFCLFGKVRSGSLPRTALQGRWAIFIFVGVMQRGKFSTKSDTSHTFDANSTNHTAFHPGRSPDLQGHRFLTPRVRPRGGNVTEPVTPKQAGTVQNCYFWGRKVKAKVQFTISIMLLPPPLGGRHLAHYWMRASVETDPAGESGEEHSDDGSDSDF